MVVSFYFLCTVFTLPWICCLDYSIFFFNHLDVFACTEALLLHAGFLQLWWAGATLHCGVCTSHCCGFSCCRAWLLGYKCSTWGAWAELHQGHVGSSQTRARTCVPCIGWWILIHCTTREALDSSVLLSATRPLNSRVLWGVFSFPSSCLYCRQLTTSSSRSKPPLSANPRSHFANWCLPLDVSWDLTPSLPKLSENNLPPYQAPCWSFCLNWRTMPPPVHFHPLNRTEALILSFPHFRPSVESTTISCRS